MNIDNTGIMQLLESRVFEDFPTLRIIMPHGGGVIPYQLARYRALSIMNKWEPFEEFMRRFYFDTAVYSPEAMELLIKIVGVDRLVFASEMLGGVTTIDPNTGRWFDDNKPLLDEIAWLSADEPAKDLRGQRQGGIPPPGGGDGQADEKGGRVGGKGVASADGAALPGQAALRTGTHRDIVMNPGSFLGL